MNIKKIFKDNIKLYIIMAIIIILGSISVTYAVKYTSFNPIAVNTTASNIDANITYDTGYSANIISNGKLLPISDSLVTGTDVANDRVLKVKFNVAGVSSNPDNVIFDIALYSDYIDCDLRTEEVKWRLYRGTDTLVSEGNLSPTFDVMNNNRMVLTNTQEDLSLTPVSYTFLLWISESCTGDITSCSASMEQNKYLNKELNASIKIELATKSKKENIRLKGSALSCEYPEVMVPVCNDLTYNASSQTLINLDSNTNYVINNNSGINAGSYPVYLTLKEGYKWTDGTVKDKSMICNIKQKNTTITTLDQTVVYSSGISKTTSDVIFSSLLVGHTLNNINLNADRYNVGTGTITANNARIFDSNNNDVTNNYNITYNNTGKVTINCLNSSVMPTASDKVYNESYQTGITGGNHVKITGPQGAINEGTYTVTVVPTANYCWSDRTTGEKTLTWQIKKDSFANYINNLYTPPTDKRVFITNNLKKYRLDEENSLMKDAAGNVRYYGGDPNNYVYFNCDTYPDTGCETWRIIGVFDDKVKIIKTTSISDISYDVTAYTDSTTSTTKYGISDWTSSELMKILNPSNYYTNSDGDVGLSLYYNKTSGSCYGTETCDFTTTGIKANTKNLIAETVYYLGGHNNRSVYPDEIYYYERGTTTYDDSRPTTWTGKIALAYPSDFGYAADLSKCVDKTLDKYDKTCKDNNWLAKQVYNPLIKSWLLTHDYLNGRGSVYTIQSNLSSEATLFFIDAGEKSYVFPVLHLNADIMKHATGNGSSESPYRLKIN